MKKLISLIGAGVLFFGGNTIAQEIPKPTVQEEIFSKLGIPQKFVNYKDGAEVTEQFNTGEWGVFYIRSYSKEGVMVRESRDVYAISSEGFESTEQPSLYAFDLDGDQEFEIEEVLFDDAADGLNGNELWFGEKILEAQYNKI